MNIALVFGRVGAPPELRYTQSGQAVLSFSIASSEFYVDKNGENKEKTTWHKCVAWRKLAEKLNVVAKKGSELIIVGETATRSYESQGKKNYITEIIVKHAGSLISGEDESQTNNNRSSSYKNKNQNQGGEYEFPA